MAPRTWDQVLEDVGVHPAETASLAPWENQRMALLAEATARCLEDGRHPGTARVVARRLAESAGPVIPPVHCSIEDRAVVAWWHLVADHGAELELRPPHPSTWEYAKQGHPEAWARSLCQVCGRGALAADHARCNVAVRVYGAYPRPPYPELGVTRA